MAPLHLGDSLASLVEPGIQQGRWGAGCRAEVRVNTHGQDGDQGEGRDQEEAGSMCSALKAWAAQGWRSC